MRIGNIKVDANEQGIHICYICGKNIQPIDEEFVETRRDTKIWVHRECVPKGRKDNGKCNQEHTKGNGTVERRGQA